MKHHIRIILVGDSDISRWPPSLYPQCSSGLHKRFETSLRNLGQSGALLSDLVPQLRQWRAEIDDSSCMRYDVFVACAGENDISSGRSLDTVLEVFRSFLDEVFHPSQQEQNHKIQNCVIFLGPKYEPWLSTDMSSRKKYTKLSSALQRTIRKHEGSTASQRVFVDCLTMFCTNQTHNVPGAIHGGRAIPDEKYFDGDGLHLNEDGYRIWKNIVEEQISNIFAVTS